MKRLACLFLPLLCSLSLSACGRSEPAPDKDPAAALRAGNSISCTAGRLALAGSGEQVGLGSFGMAKGMLDLGLTLHAARGDEVHIVSTSLMAMPLKEGTYHFPDAAARGPSYAFYEIRDSERNLLKQYSGSHYWLHFSPLEVDPDAKLKFVVEKLGVSASPHAGMRRVHLAGSFAFHGAALPDNKQSDACSKDGILRSIKSLNGKRLLPMYDPKVCGAEKIHVQCRYDVTADLPSQ